MTKKISIVTPVFNEEDCLSVFFDTVTGILEKTDCDFEIIAVNDGSSDNTENVIKSYCEKDKRIKGVTFSRNFGQMQAIFCGLERSSGDAVIVMDADLQDSPEIIPEMIAKWQEGYHVVNACRTERKGETFFKKFTSKAFITVTNKLSGLKMPIDSGEFKLYDRKVINAIINLQERARYLRAQTAWLGFKQTAVYFDRKERVAGTTKYNFKKMLRLAENAIIPNSPKLLDFTKIIGLLTGLSSLATFIVFIVLACIGKGLPLNAWLFPTVVMATSLILLNNSLTNKYIAYMYEDVKKRPVYVEQDVYNF